MKEFGELREIDFESKPASASVSACVSAPFSSSASVSVSLSVPLPADMDGRAVPPTGIRRGGGNTSGAVVRGGQ